MEHIEILASIVFPAIVSLFVSVIAFLIQRMISRKGKLRVYFKLSSPNASSLRIDRDVAGGMQIHVPVLLEVYNPASTTKIIRDISAFLSYHGKPVFLLDKAQALQEVDPVTGRTIRNIGGDNGSFSFTIESNAIVSKWFLFVGVIKNQDVDTSFDEIRVSLYDFKNKKRVPVVYKTKEIKRLGQPTRFDDCIDDWQVFKV